jgi:DNA polymerase III delta subunit
VDAADLTAAGGPGDASELAMRLATAPLFGRGILLVIREPAAAARGAAGRDRLLQLAQGVAPGNGLAFTAVVESRAREPAGLAAVRAAVEAAGGTVRHLEGPRQTRLPGWIQDRAEALGMRIDPVGARELAVRIAGSGGEGDVDRRRHTEFADAELRKLALYRPDSAITRDDVAALVPAAAPASTWAFLDAVGRRDVRAAGSAAELLVAEGAPLPVVVTQLHRRLRQLLIIRSLVETGEKPPAIARAAGITGPPKTLEFRFQTLSRQAASWEPAELTEALVSLVEVDLVSKGLPVNGRPARRGSAEGPTALLVWLAERVTRRR